MTEWFDAATLEALIEDGRRRELPSKEIAAAILALSEDPVWAKAMAHPARGHILRLLREHGELCPAEAVGHVDGMSLGTLSYHFRHLRKLGLFELSQTIPRRGALQHRYRLTDATNGASAPTVRSAT
jgi:DNA-binding transcriptional ArsR family regulator